MLISRTTVSASMCNGSERSNSDHMTSAQAPPHATVRPALHHANETCFPIYLSIVLGHHPSFYIIFCSSPSPSLRLRPPDNSNRTAPHSMADATSACLANSRSAVLCRLYLTPRRSECPSAAASARACLAICPGPQCLGFCSGCFLSPCCRELTTLLK